MPIEIGLVGADVPSIVIRCDGQALALTAQFSVLNISTQLHGGGNATVRFVADVGDGYPTSALEAAPLGSSLSIELTVEGVARPIFIGIVESQQVYAPSGRVPELVLVAVSRSTPLVLNDSVGFVARYGNNLLALEAAMHRTGDADSESPGAPDLYNGYALVSGTTAVQPGALLRVAGIGRLFDQNVRIVEVQQSIAVTGWTTRIDFSTAEV